MLLDLRDVNKFLVAYVMQLLKLWDAHVSEYVSYNIGIMQPDNRRIALNCAGFFLVGLIGHGTTSTCSELVRFSVVQNLHCLYFNIWVL